MGSQVVAVCRGRGVVAGCRIGRLLALAWLFLAESDSDGGRTRGGHRTDAAIYLARAFNPVTLNAGMMALSIVGYMAALDTPSASNCLRRPSLEALLFSSFVAPERNW